MILRLLKINTMHRILFFLLLVFQLAAAQSDGSDISIPIYSLPTKSNDFDFDVTMQYNVNTISAKYLANEIGLGWDTQSFGVISRNINNIPDDIPIQTTVNGVPKTDVSEYTSVPDEFNFNIGGIIGNFKIIKDGTTGNYIVSYSNTSQLNYVVKFINTKYSSTVSDSGVTSFEIIDENGIHYFFEEYEYQEIQYKNITYSVRMNYLLTRVVDANNNILGSITYQKQIVPFYTPLVSGELLLTKYDLKKVYQITADGFGQMTFKYTQSANYTANSTEGNDPFQLNELEIVDALNNKIKKFVFGYDFMSNNKLRPRRTLIALDEYGYNAATSTYEGPLSTQFNYNTNIAIGNSRLDQYGFTDYSQACDYLSVYNPENNSYYVVNPNGKNYGALSEIIYPTGKKVQYEFESNSFSRIAMDNNISTSFFDYKNISNHSVSDATTYNFDSAVSVNAKSATGADTFTVQKGGVYYFKLVSNLVNVNTSGIANVQENWLQDPNSGNDWGIYLLNATTGAFVGTYYSSQQIENNLCLGLPLQLTPGTYKMALHIKGAITRVAGSISIYGSNIAASKLKYTYGAGLRIRNIKVSNAKTLALSKSNTYYYNLFGDTYSSSGILMPEDQPLESNNTYKSANVFYTNLTIVDDLSGVITEMVYKSPLEPTTNYEIPYSYIYKDGFLLEKRVRKLSKDIPPVMINYQTEVNDYQLFTANMLANSFDSTFKSEPITEYLLTKTTTKSIDPNLKEVVETFDYDLGNLKLKQSTKTNSINASTQEVTTKTFDYETTVKAKTNAVVLKTEKELLNSTLLWTKTYNYKNVADAYPNYKIALTSTSMAKGTGANQTLSEVISYDADNIHPTEVRSGGLVSTLLVWGYNKTQLILTIENYVAATDSPLIGTLVTTLQNYSNANDEANMLATMRAIQAKVPTKMVTGTTYKPLIGVSQTLDARGNVTTNEYNAFGRLIKVKDFNGSLIQEYQYNYAH